MWEQYRKTLIPIQLMILTICSIAYYGVGLTLRPVMFYFLAMQMFAIIGAKWAVRLKGKVERSKKDKNGLRDLLA